MTREKTKAEARAEAYGLIVMGLCGGQDCSCIGHPILIFERCVERGKKAEKLLQWIECQ